MLQAFAYLTIRSARNRVRRQFARVRQPRYAIAMLLALLYVGAIFLPGWRHPTSSTPAGLFLHEEVFLVASLAALLLAAYWWLLGKDTGALAFSPAEVQFLFPAPTTRRQLIEFKLIRTQAVILINIVIWTVILGRGRGAGDLVWVRPLSLWVMLSTVQLHRLGATLTRTNLTSHGTAGLRRSGVAAAVVTALLAAVVVGIVGHWPAAGVHGPREALTVLQRATDSGAARWALLPVQAVLAPLFAETLAAWVASMGPAVVIMLVHFAWVLYSDTAFEDAAVEASAQRADRATARRSGFRFGLAGDRPARRAALRLPLAPVGEPAVAIAWKNAHAAMRNDRFFWQAVIFGVGALAVSIGAYFNPDDFGGFAIGIVVAWGAMSVLMGPIWLRNDLRADLPRLELLRTFPVNPRRFVAAELGSTALLLSFVQLFLVAAALIATLHEPGVHVRLDERIALAVAAALALPPINALGACIHNASALLFPGWMTLGGDRKPGFEAMGQVYLIIIIVVVAMAVLLLLPTGAAALALLLLYRQYGYWSAIPAVLAGAAIVGGELALLVRWLGGVFARTEPSEVGAG